MLQATVGRQGAGIGAGIETFDEPEVGFRGPHHVADADGPGLIRQAQAAAARLASGPFSTPDGVAYGQGAKLGKVAFLFPGQGSQLVEMGGEVAGLLDAAIVPWDVAAGVHMGAERLHDVVFPRPVFSDEDRAAQQDKLTRTEWAQPALGATSLALAASAASSFTSTTRSTPLAPMITGTPTYMPFNP